MKIRWYASTRFNRKRPTWPRVDWRSLRHVQQVAPDIATVCLTSEYEGEDTVQRGRDGASPWTAGLDVDDFDGSVPRLVKAAGCAVWSTPNACDSGAQS